MRTPRYLSLLMAALLAILQLFAPWVHAHTRGETGGVLHVPGLEYLQSRSLELAEARADWGSPDRLVTLESATEARPFVGSAERKDGVIGVWVFPRDATPAKISAHPHHEGPNALGPPLKPDISGSSPRAPPVSISSYS